jgi:cytochrome c biogenesis protein CcmG/thiol:disulfide interchange protein DsbE
MQLFIIMDGSAMSKTNALKLAVLVLFLGGAVYLALRERSPRPLAIGDRAPDFAVPALPSGSLALSKYRRQVVVLNFWATWCPPCVEETPSLEQFAERMQGQGVVVVGVSVDDNSNALEEFVRRYGITYAIGLDPDRSLAARFGTFQFPETYILDRHGRLAEKLIGAVNWDDPRIQSFVLELARGSAR